ncbi:UNVERIFIED_CONTAM: protein UXT [Sesamum radiatum]|uniref:Protein UXT n=1 Tax=Sesamum radiatum TaxID=300843 RepID=A0AAW2JSM9_SESRA
MDSAKQDKVRKFEEFVDRRLKPDLVHAIAQRDKIFEQQKIFSDLRRNIENLEKNSVTSLRTLVNLGSEVYMQADVPDMRHIFVDVGLGFHVEFTWSEALNFIAAREEKLSRQIEEYTRLIASIKAQIKMMVCKFVDNRFIGGLQISPRSKNLASFSHFFTGSLFSFSPFALPHPSPTAPSTDSMIIVGLIAFAFGGFTVLVYNGFALFGVEIDYENVYFRGFVILIFVLLVGLLIYLQVEWYLANVVVVVESQWGLAPLKRSSYLVKGMRRVAFSMIMLFGVLLGLLAMSCSSLVPDVGGIREGWVSWAFIFQTVVYTGFMTILMLYSIAANAVLFMYCKALHGELAFEIAEEFAREYVSLPFDDGKVPHVVYVV